MVRNYVNLFKMGSATLSYQAGWELAPHGRLSWLHRLLWRALVRLKALGPAIEYRTEVLRLPIDNDSIFRRILEAYEGLFAINARPSKVLIGPRTLDGLISCPEVREWNSPFTFTARAGFNNTIFDLPICVVPQMEGVVVLDERTA